LIKKAKKKAPISIASRKAKARKLQQWVAKWISDITGIPCGKDELIESREMGQAGTDVKLIGPAQQLFPFAVECKRQEKLNLHEAIKQAKVYEKDGINWLVFHKRNDEDTYVTLKADTFFKIYRGVINEVRNKKDNDG
jgi:hypothetical protein